MVVAPIDQSVDERELMMASSFVRAFLVALLFLLIPTIALTQSSAPQPAAAGDQLLKSEELEALVAPVALYPDALLSLVLMASTYPLEVVQADRWAKENKGLKGDALKTAADKQKWDDSVKSLVATPDALAMMSSKLDWTQKLGDAVLAQQPDVMDAIQRMRSKAQANDKLKSTREQTVTVKQQANKQVIVIEPTEPNTIHVPYYDPAVVYGSWPYAAYPPYYFPPPGYIAGGIIATGIAFGAGYALGRWASGGNYWGGGANWGGNNITVNRPVNINNSGNNWQHKPEHRQGVRYGNRDVQQKFGGNRGGGQDRTDFRGRGGEQVLNPRGGDRASDRAGDRSGDRAGDRGANARPGGADRGPGDRGGGRQDAANKAGNRGAGNRAPSQKAGQADRARPSGGNRSAGGGRDNAFGNVNSGGAARAHSQRGQASLGARGGGGGHTMAMGGGGRAAAGGGGMRGGGGGRRSDVRVKHDIAYLGQLDNGLGFYRFAYHGERRPYVGVMAHEVQAVVPEAVVQDASGYLRVRYDMLGLKFQSYDRWMASGAKLPAVSGVHH